jgi:ElaB/YqjD/DUF883 family membrane-anchored ribosome-binding protein
MAPTDTAGRESSPHPGAEPLREILSSVGSAAREKAKELSEISRAKLDEIKKKSLEDLYSDAKTYVRENPGKTLVGALAAGFILGRLFRRR